jgi:hypothetical protein
MMGVGGRNFVPPRLVSRNEPVPVIMLILWVLESIGQTPIRI